MMFWGTYLKAEISRKYSLFRSALSIFIFLLPSFAAAENISLSLSDALAAAVKQNSLLRFSGLGEKISDNELNIQKSIYVPTVSVDVSSEFYNTESQTIQGYTNQENSHYQIAAAAKNSLGGVTSLNLMSRKDKHNYLSGISAKEYTSEIFMRYEQPLLKGFGREITNLEIDKAALNKGITQQVSEDTKSQILFNVFRDYFLLHRSTEELRLKREIRKNTEEILEMVREKVDARMLPVTEQKTVEAMLSIQDKEILDLANRKKQQQNQLMMSIQNEPLAVSVDDVTLLSVPKDVVVIFSDPEPMATKNKMEATNMELLNLSNELALLEKEKQKAQNDLRPNFSLAVEAGIDGVDQNSLTNSIGNISTRNYRTAIMGTLAFPVENRAALNSLAKMESRIEQIKIQIANKKNEIRRVVDELFMNIVTVRKKIALDKEIVALTKQNFDNEIERLMRGKSTALNTFDYQTNYITARLGMLNTDMDFLLLIGSYFVYTRRMDQLAGSLHRIS